MVAMQNYRLRNGEDTGKLLEVAGFYNRREQIMELWEISRNFDSEFSE